MYYLLSWSLFLFFLFSYHIPCASSNQGLEWCEALFQCGNITTGFPFWGGNRQKPCGHPLLELHCNNNITSLFISSQEFYILRIDKTSKTLVLVRPDHLGSFCSSAFNTTTLPPEIFELSPAYKTLTVLYNCDPKNSYRSSYACPLLGRFSMSKNQDSCKDNFTVNVPMSFLPEERELNLSNLETALRKGFEVKLVIDEQHCQKCLSSGGICGFNRTTQNCCKGTSPSGVSCVPYQPIAGDLYGRCIEGFSCANQDHLSYPFWKPGKEECGHPDFKVDCSGAFPELNIASVKFRILYIPSYGEIHLARLDYIDDICPPNTLNAPVIESVLQLTADTDLLTLYYNCQFQSSAPSASSYVGELGCDGGSSYYVTRNLSSPLLDGIRSLLNNLRGMCKRNVSIPASGSTLTTLQRTPTQENLKEALKQGFKLVVNSDCMRCASSGGVCGYNQTSSMFVCYCKDGPENQTCPLDGSLSRFDVIAIWTLIIIATGLCSLTGIIALLLVLCPCFRIQIFRKRKTSDERRQEKLKALIPLKHYTYKQVKKMTNSFAEVIGRGGFRIVYRGTLSDGRMVAVKVLKELKGNNGDDFINEVASMSQTSHVNIVSLLGFCSEGSKRAIIYEFLGNGSLDKFIADKSLNNLDLATLYGIALGVARGLEYLHYDCKKRIVHFDIKPQNVLLDDSLCPKVSDFGLARLCENKESIMSLLEMRGTIGYIAPEMISRVYGSVSHKSDVYSYGMLVMDMLGARKKERVDQNTASNASSMYFPEWIYKDLERVGSGRLIENGISIEEEAIAKKMTLVGLWCIQSSPSNRPPMNRVVEMMEGSLEALEVPPRPVLQQIPAAPLSESFGISEENSSSSEILISSTN